MAADVGRGAASVDDENRLLISGWQGAADVGRGAERGRWQAWDVPSVDDETRLYRQGAWQGAADVGWW
eukprot:1188496-Prorocentrum_minimum.AAC.2